MSKVFRSGLYSVAHSRLFWVAVVLLTAFAVFTVKASVTAQQPAERFYFVTGGRDPELEAAVASLDLMGGLENHLSYWEGRREYQLSPTAYAVISELPEYQYLLERGDFLHCYEIGLQRYDVDEWNALEQNIFEQWAVTGVFADNGGAIVASLFFAALFFSRPHMHRIYTADAMFGVKRRDMVLGRMLAYLIICAVITTVQTALAFAIYAPGVPGAYGHATMLRGMAARLACDLFFYGVVAMFPLVIRRPMIAFFVSFVVVVQLFSNRAVVFIPITDMFNTALDRIVTGEGFFAAYLPLLACTIAAFIVSAAASVLYMRRARLK